MRKQAFFLVAAATLIGCGKSQAPTEVAGTSTPKPVEILTIRRQSAPIFFEATGNVKSKLNAILASKVMARVDQVGGREGDLVRAGQVLVTLDPRELTAGVDVARANLRASLVGIESARTSREMEVQTSAARISQAQAAVQQAKAALGAAQSKLDLAIAGPRSQERTQAHLAVVQADSSLKLAKIQLDRVAGLVTQGAMPKKDLDVAQNAYDVALAQRDSAVQNERISQEGTRSEDLRTSREGVAQAEAAVRQAEANLAQARAGALQTRVRMEEIRSAQAQATLSAAALRSAEVSLAYATVTAPFDGQIVQRTVDPGSMATPGSPLLAIEGGGLRLEAIVPEGVLAHVGLGEEIRVRVDALGRDFSATVAEIVPQGDTGSHSFIVKLSLPNTAGIKSGMFGRAFVPTGSEERIEVPSAAVWEREGMHYVYAVNPDGIVRLRIVTIGVGAGDRIAVLSGLSPGDRIVSGSRENVSDGSKVVAK